MYEEIIESIEKGGYSASEREVLKKAFGYFLILLGGTYFISCFVKKIREK